MTRIFLIERNSLGCFGTCQEDLGAYLSVVGCYTTERKAEVALESFVENDKNSNLDFEYVITVHYIDQDFEKSNLIQENETFLDENHDPECQYFREYNSEYNNCEHNSDGLSDHDTSE